MPAGGVSNSQMTEDAKTCIQVSRVFDLSSAITTEAVLYDPIRPLAILDMWVVYVTETAAAGSAVDIGTIADADAVVDAYTIADSSDTVGSEEQLTLATTLATSKQALGLPVLPASTPLVWSNAASGGAGQVVLFIRYYPLDVSSK